MRLAIGAAARILGLSPDTLRYYEKIQLIPRPVRGSGGRRHYDDRDLARLRFVRRAQALGFTLAEIRQLLRFRKDPVRSSRAVRSLAAQKCEALAAQSAAIGVMQRELSLLLNLCSGARDHCPILDHLETG